MFDGFKSEHGYLLPDAWLNNRRLDFAETISMRTGERIPEPLKARHEGLLFEIIPKQRNPDHSYLVLQGSLHKYFNGGDHNHNDFTLSDVQGVISSLKDFSIVPELAGLRNLEFGINLRLGFPARRLIRSIVCLGNDPFEQMNIRRMDLGRWCDRTEYRVKIYDKGRQSNLKVNDLVRIELAVKRMRYLSRFGIRSLDDLTDPRKVSQLGDHLAGVFSQIILYDHGINRNQLTPRERERLAYFLNPNYWQGLERKKRYKKRLRFEALKSKYSASDLQKDIAILIVKKWEYLVGYHQEREVQKSQDLESFGSTYGGGRFHPYM